MDKGLELGTRNATHVFSHHSYYCKVTWSKPSQALTAGELCLIWCVQHSATGTIAESSATVSSTLVHAWVRYLTAIANLSCLFFPPLSRGLEYMRVKCKAHLFQCHLTCLSVLRENTTADKRELGASHQQAVLASRAYSPRNTLFQDITLVQASHIPTWLSFIWKENP